MKKVEAAKAQAIVGGTKLVCTSSFDWVSYSGGDYCAEIKTCSDKTGRPSTSVQKAADESACPSIPNS